MYDKFQMRVWENASKILCATNKMLYLKFHLEISTQAKEMKVPQSIKMGKREFMCAAVHLELQFHYMYFTAFGYDRILIRERKSLQMRWTD